MDSLGFHLISGAVGIYLLWNFFLCYRGREADLPIPGAQPAPARLIALGVVGALAILGLETGGEIALGIADEQSTLPVFALIGLLAAGVIEEVIFRGYVVLKRGSKVLFWPTALFGSTIFALLHPFLWDFEGGFPWLVLDAKSLFSTSIIFLNSIWFYALRFSFGNARHSLIPCIVAHAMSNLGVFVVKAFQGFVAI